MSQREGSGAHDRKQRHRFRETVDRVAPGLPQQRQNGGDQRPGVADTDPPDEVDDGKAPPDGDVDTPDPDAFQKKVAEDPGQHIQHAEHDQEAEDPSQRNRALQHNVRDLLGDGGESVAGRDDRHSPVCHRNLRVRCHALPALHLPRTSF